MVFGRSEGILPAHCQGGLLGAVCFGPVVSLKFQVISFSSLLGGYVCVTTTTTTKPLSPKQVGVG